MPPKREIASAHKQSIGRRIRDRKCGHGHSNEREKTEQENGNVSSRRGELLPHRPRQNRRKPPTGNADRLCQ